jgi:hypothetical protein
MQTCVFNERTTTCGKDVRSCDDFAACVFETTCNARPRGGLSCGQTMQCMAGCGNDNGCACQCAGQMALAHAQLMLRLFLCLASCNNDPTCAQQRCSGFGTQCLQQ